MRTIFVQAMKKIDAENAKKVRQFCLLLAVVFAALAFVASRTALTVLWLLLALVFATFGIWRPRAAKHLYRIWMMFAVTIGVCMSTVLLTIFFFAVITPLGIMLRALHKDLLGERMERGAVSYWRECRWAEQSDQYKHIF